MPNIVGLNRIFENKEQAIESFGELGERLLSRSEDGKQVLARYFDEDGNVASLIGVYHYKRTEQVWDEDEQTDIDVDYGNIEIRDGNINNDCMDYLESIVEELDRLAELVTSASTALDELELQVDVCCPPETKNYLTFTNVGQQFQKLILTDYTGNNPTLYYSLDNGETFEEWIPTSGVRTVEVELGNNVKIYGNNLSGFSFGESTYSAFSSQQPESDKWEASGDVTTLISEDGVLDLPCDYCFANLFEFFTSLITPPDFPATGLTDYCYYRTFAKCANLRHCPVLPADIIHEGSYQYMFNSCAVIEVMPALRAMTLDEKCYYGMFSDCASLNTVSELPAERVFAESYSHMFISCRALETPQEILPALELAVKCYEYMFANCVKLKKCPKLPAKKLYDYCYSNMFNTCSDNLMTLDENMLIEAADDNLAPYCYSHMFENCYRLNTPMRTLPSATFKVYCYEYMFNNCYTLKVTPIFGTKSMEEGCFQYMFRNCSSLYSEYVYVDINNRNYAPKNCCREMFSGCINLKETIRMTQFTSDIYERCFAGMYSGCTSLYNCDEVVFANNVAEACYEDMFAYTKIVKPRQLPALEGATDCYKGMFKNCSELIILDCQLLEPSSSFTAGWVENVTTSGTFFKNGGIQASEWTSLPTSDGVPVNWSIS